MVDRIPNLIVEETAQLFHRFFPGGCSTFGCDQFLQKDCHGSDADTAQISDGVPVFIQTEWTKHHRALFKDGPVLRQEFDVRQGLRFDDIKRAACHGMIP